MAFLTNSVDLNAIQRETGPTAAAAVGLILRLLRVEQDERLRTVTDAKQTLEPFVYTAAPTTNQDNVDIGQASIVYYTGSTNFNLSGFRCPDPGKARFVVLHNSGSANITVKHEATSSSSNQFHLSTGADKTVGTDKALIFVYLDSKWRDITLV